MAKLTLRSARINRGYTQVEAAEKLGVAVSTLRNWEQGHHYPRQPQIEKMCRVYKVQYDDLIFLPNGLAIS